MYVCMYVCVFPSQTVININIYLNANVGVVHSEEFTHAILALLSLLSMQLAAIMKSLPTNVFNKFDLSKLNIITLGSI